MMSCVNPSAKYHEPNRRSDLEAAERRSPVSQGCRRSCSKNTPQQSRAKRDSKDQRGNHSGPQTSRRSRKRGILRPRVGRRPLDGHQLVFSSRRWRGCGPGLNIRFNFEHIGFKSVAPARNSPDQMCAVLSKALSQFANALHQHIVGYCEVWPDCGKPFLFRNKTAAILEQRHRRTAKVFGRSAISFRSRNRQPRSRSRT